MIIDINKPKTTRELNAEGFETYTDENGKHWMRGAGTDWCWFPYNKKYDPNVVEKKE